MGRYRSRPPRATRSSGASDVPLFIRFCSGFVDNLGLVLRVGLVLGAIVLVADFRLAIDSPEEPRPAAQILKTDAAPALERSPEPVRTDPVMSEGVRRALNCTYQDYRNAHYDECVDEPSDVYRSPEANPDDRGSLWDRPSVLLAHNHVQESPAEL